jgi:hypothetical protein
MGDGSRDTREAILQESAGMADVLFRRHAERQDPTIQQHGKKWLDLPWQKVRDSVDVKLYEHEESCTYWLRAKAGKPSALSAIPRRAALLVPPESAVVEQNSAVR